jgi:hypothetical protein
VEIGREEFEFSLSASLGQERNHNHANEKWTYDRDPQFGLPIKVASSAIIFSSVAIARMWAIAYARIKSLNGMGKYRCTIPGGRNIPSHYDGLEQ